MMQVGVSNSIVAYSGGGREVCSEGCIIFSEGMFCLGPSLDRLAEAVSIGLSSPQPLGFRADTFCS